MRITAIILKSGTKIDISDADGRDFISRENIKLTYRGFPQGEETRWEPTPQKEIVNFLRVVKGNKTWEFKEDEIAAFEYSEDNIKSDIII